jgi:O-antigen ligase
LKWLLLLISIALIVPVSGWFRRNPAEMPKIWMLMGFLVFEHGAQKLYMAIISWAAWPGHTKGLEFSIVDALALSLYLSLPNLRQRLPFAASMAFYFFASLLSSLQTNVPESALFYCWQLARAFLVYAVVARGCADPRVPSALLKGMVIALALEACLAAFQKVGGGMLQAGGSFGHQNMLGLMSHFVAFPAFALLLAGEAGWYWRVAPVAGSLVAILTVSRATFGLAVIGYVLTFTALVMRGWTSRKARVALLGVVAVAVLAPLAVSSFESRQAIFEPDEERAAFEKAAALMLADHPFGVGANNYVVIANTAGYSDRAGVIAVAGSRSATVHNTYWLVAAETGYIGLVAFLIMLVRPLIVAFRCGWSARGDPQGDLLLGLGVSLLVVYVHSLFEWVFITFQAQYMLGLSVGLVAGLAQQLGYWQKPPGRVSQQRVAIGEPVAEHPWESCR